MAEIEIVIPDRVDSEISQLVEQGEYVNRKQAIEELLSLGVSAYESTGSEGEPLEDWEMQAAADREDPAGKDDRTDNHRRF